MRLTSLDQTFAAVADPTRRAMLEQLRRKELLSITQLARPFAMSLPAVLKHVNVLSTAGLIQCEKRGRTVTCRLSARPMRDAVRWMERYEGYWSRKLDRLATFVESEGDD
jgi:DNA-binding transcriptional ArsR family regulator